MFANSQTDLKSKYWTQAVKLISLVNPVPFTNQPSSSSEFSLFEQLGRSFVSCLNEGLGNNKVQNLDKLMQILAADLQLIDESIPLSYFLGFSIFNGLMALPACFNLNLCMEKLQSSLNDPLRKQQLGRQNFRQQNRFVARQNYEKLNLTAKETQHHLQQSINSTSNPISSSSEDSLIFQEDFFTSSQPRNQSTIADSFQGLSLIQEDEDIDSNIITNESQQVKSYLMKLPKASTQLNFLYQFMKWPPPKVTEKKSTIKDDMLSCELRVEIKACDNKSLFLTGKCFAAQSKKEARQVAALLALWKIYNRFPDVWQRSKQIRKQKQTLQQLFNANNQWIFEQAKFPPLDMSILNQDTILSPKDQQITDYLQTLKNFKQEIQIFRGKYKQISSPKYQIKPDKMGWAASAKIYDNDSQVLRAEACESSKKKAEEMCCKDLLFQLYSKNRNRWEQFKQYKKQRNL